MNLIDKQLAKIKREKRFGLMTHVVVGYPSISKTVSLVKTMAEVGVDFIELQIPFSDPLADGPTIMMACEKSLRNGTKVKDAFSLVSILSKQIDIPLLFMTYYNTVFKYGVRKFCQNAKRVGISGLIIPDIPIEEENKEHFVKYCKEADIKTIRVVSPVSTIDRLKKNARIADGFIYCTARQGITGVKKELDPKIYFFLKNVKKYFKIPIAVGFGISNKKRMELITPLADMAVVGSAIIDIINNSKNSEVKERITTFIKSLRQ